jgi:hypothetical protein
MRAFRHPVRAAFAFCAAAVYSWFVALTTAFTFRADAMTAIPLMIAAIVAIASRHDRNRRPGSAIPRTDAPRRLWPWWVVTTVTIAWEIFCFLELPRAKHPTISSLYDSASGTRLVKAALFLGWLALGWIIVHKGHRART